MSQDSVRTCPNCKRKDITDFRKCRFCSTEYDTKVYDMPKERSGNHIFLGLAVLLVLLVLNYYWYQSFHSNTTAAELADLPSDIPALLLPPVQVTMSPPQVLTVKDCTVTKVASYVVTARILSTSRAWLDAMSNLAPVDLTLGWGLMADKRLISQVWVTSGGRWADFTIPNAKNLYKYYPKKEPVRPWEIFTHVGNTHIIPASDRIRKMIGSLRRDQIVTLKGALVRVNLPDGRHWNSSMSREDMGDGGCEIMYVEDIEIH
jgi:hypothetical protein